VFGRIVFASLPALFSVTLFLSASLLFLVELMIAKMILPLFGGTPAVWNTCMMFFQAILLLGYGYAHLSGTRIRLHRQIVVHLAILLIACVVLPIAIPRQWAPSAGGSPIGDILLLLLVAVGPPFFVLSSTAPLLQQWFARTGHPSAKDPYYLYSASNLGSMLALISYPTLVEPHFRLAEQSGSWAIGYLIILIMSVVCAVVTKKYLSVCAEQAPGNEMLAAGACAAGGTQLTYGERGRWIILAFVPSSLMLGVTTFLSTDVAAIPLFWVIPLSLYLLSFIIVFARVPTAVHRASVLLLPISISLLVFVHLSDIDIPKWTVFAFHLANFFITCMVCHGEIARTRPHTEHLTEYYLWMSFGGVLGGIFNSLVAPVIFNTVLEYPLILILGAMLLPVKNPPGMRDPINWRYILLYIEILVVFVPFTYWSTEKWAVPSINVSWLPDYLQVASGTLDLLITYGIPVLLCYSLVFLRKPFLFGIGVGAILLTVLVAKDMKKDIVYRERSFFGVLTVTRASDGTFMNLMHGTTLHGKQWLNPVTRFEPVSYYHRKGPVGKVFDEFSGKKKKTRIAVTGLGTGSIAAYAGPGQAIDFYEIDPAVRKISANPDYFSFLSYCRAQWRVVLGDARLTMEKAAPPHSYGIIILDAFSSDSIPVHLLTKEAIALYFSKLEEDGVLLVHISNKYVSLAPVLETLAEESGYAARICDDDEDYEIAKDGSTWVLLATTEKNFGSLAEGDEWKKIDSRKKVKVWTDDFSNILSVFRW
jgi:hypothetical protein